MEIALLFPCVVSMALRTAGTETSLVRILVAGGAVPLRDLGENEAPCGAGRFGFKEFASRHMALLTARSRMLSAKRKRRAVVIELP